MQVDFLVISPHPDDAEYAVSGSVARWTREGKKAVYVVCTDGDKGTSDRNLTPSFSRSTRNRMISPERTDLRKITLSRAMVRKLLPGNSWFAVM